jgi:hypothetical protein
MARTSTQAMTRTPIQTAALAFGIVFTLVGIMGFIPGVTSNFDTIQFAGHESEAMLLGIFAVSILHNLVHLAFGVAGIAAARRMDWSRTFLIGGGLIYALLWIYGLLIDKDSDANFVPLNTADDWLHFGLAVTMIGAGFALSRRSDTARSSAT